MLSALAEEADIDSEHSQGQGDGSLDSFLAANSYNSTQYNQQSGFTHRVYHWFLQTIYSSLLCKREMVTLLVVHWMKMTVCLLPRCALGLDPCQQQHPACVWAECNAALHGKTTRLIFSTAVERIHSDFKKFYNAHRHSKNLL